MTRISYSTTDLDTLCTQLTDWRRRQTGRMRLPGDLWSSAARLARSLGVGPVARRLRLDYYKLKRLAAGTPDPLTEAVSPVGFVEVALAPSAGLGGAPGYSAHLHDGAAGRLTLQLGGDLGAVMALAEAFWKRPR